MPAFIRENLPYKIAALIFAVLLHIYVAGQQSPSRVMTVPLAVRGLPPSLLLGEDAPRQMMLTLSGPADAVDQAGPGDVSAYVDLTHARAGKGLVAPVLVSTTGDLRADPAQDTVTLSLLPRETRRLDVAAADPGPALSGYRYEAPLISPRAVTVSGPQDAVDAVTRLVVKTDAPADVGTVDGDFDIVALDAQGGQVQDVTLTPARAHVVIHMVRAPVVKTVPVSPDVTGALAAGRQIGGVEVSPRLVLISGSAARLAQITSVGTAPVDISNAVSDVTRTVNCVAPPGVTFTGASAVTVVLHVTSQPAPGQTPTAPAPPVSPPASNPTVPQSGPPVPSTP